MSRTVQIGRATYLEEDKPGGGVTRTLLSGSADIIRPGDAPSFIERGPTWTRTRPSPARRKPVLPARTLDVEVPDLRRDRTPTLTVKLNRSALCGISAELERSDGLLDALETGGNLFGRRRDGVIEITNASGPGTDGEARRFPNAVMVSIMEAFEDAATLQRTWSDIYFIGGWHTHPIDVREPSEVDRANALQAIDQGEVIGSRWIDLILTSDSARGWSQPRVSGWATRRVSDYGAVTEPIVIAGRFSEHRLKRTIIRRDGCSGKACGRRRRARRLRAKRRLGIERPLLD